LVICVRDCVIVGCAVLTCRTIPFQLLIWLLMGIIRYTTRPKQSAKTVQDWDRVVAVTRAARRLKRKTTAHANAATGTGTTNPTTSTSSTSNSHGNGTTSSLSSTPTPSSPSTSA
jgi:hypothetical protein